MKKSCHIGAVLLAALLCFVGCPVASAASVQPITATVSMQNGSPRLFLDGELATGNLFFINGDCFYGSQQIYAREVAKSAAAGVHLYSTIYNIDFAADLTQNPATRYAHLQNILNQILRDDPNAKILLRLSLISLASTLGEDACEDGANTGWVTLASDKWVQETVERVQDMVAYILSVPAYAQSVFGYHLDYGEWFPRNFTAQIDQSATNSAKFRTWLTEKYQTDANLRSAWANSTVRLSTAKVPSNQPINSSASNTLLLDLIQQQYIDYNRYFSELTADRIDTVAKAIKQTTDNKSIVIAFYGYYFEQYHATTGHWALQKLLQSDAVDGFASPTSYIDRTTNALTGSSAYMSAADSITRAGKLWLMESDQRTYIYELEGTQDTGGLPPLQSVSEIIEVHRREMGIAMVHGTAMYPMDLTGCGWYDNAAVWDHFGNLDVAAKAYAASATEQGTFDVCLVVDERATAMVGAAANLQSGSLMQTEQNLYRAGVSFALAEMQDVLAGKFADCKLFLFVNPYALSNAEATQLATQMRQSGKTAVYLYGFGNLSAASVEALTGMQMTKVNQTVSHQMNLTATATQVIPGLETVAGCTGNPKTVCTSYTKALGTYSDGEVGFATCQSQTGNAVFCGGSVLTAQNIRALAGFAGVNVYCATDDMVTANQNMVVLSAKTAGTKTVSFGKKVDVYDYFHQRWFDNTATVTLQNLSAGETVWLFYGSRAEITGRQLPAIFTETVSVSAVTARPVDQYGITEVRITLNQGGTTGYDAINSGIASPTPPDYLLNTVEHCILFNGVSIDNTPVAVFVFLESGTNQQVFSIRYYNETDTGKRLCDSDFTFEILSGARDGEGRGIEPCRYNYNAQTDTFTKETDTMKTAVQSFTMIYHQTYVLTEMVITLDKTEQQGSLREVQSPENSEGSPSAQQYETVSDKLLLNGVSTASWMEGRPWYAAVRCYYSSGEQHQQIDLYYYDLLFDGKPLYNQDFTFEILPGAVDYAGQEIAPGKYFYSVAEHTVSSFAATALPYFRHQILKDAYNATLDFTGDGKLDVRDLIRCKKTLSEVEAV